MSDDDYQVQNVHRYIRKTFKNKKDLEARNSCHEQTPMASEDRIPCESESNEPATHCCPCGFERDGEIANILHKKCPVINLAQQQIENLLNKTDNLLGETNARTLCEFLNKFKDILMENKGRCLCFIIFLIVNAFMFGLLLGTATCSSYPGHFDSPISTCIDNYFIRYKTKLPNTLRSIV